MSVAAPSRVSVIEVAEAMYQAGRADVAAKTPETLDDVSTRTQERYLLLAKASISVTGLPAPGAIAVFEGAGDDLLELLAEEFAWKLNHPQQFSDQARTALAEFADRVGLDNVSDEVRQAMRI